MPTTSPVPCPCHPPQAQPERQGQEQGERDTPGLRPHLGTWGLGFGRWVTPSGLGWSRGTGDGGAEGSWWPPGVGGWVAHPSGVWGHLEGDTGTVPGISQQDRDVLAAPRRDGRPVRPLEQRPVPVSREGDPAGGTPGGWAGL